MNPATPERFDLRCPRCRDADTSARVRLGPQGLVCAGCGASFPMVEGAAVLVRDPDALIEAQPADPDLTQYLLADFAREPPLAWPAASPVGPCPTSWLVPHLTPGSRVVDLGCGVGGAAFRLASAGHDVLGLDLRCGRIQAALQLRSHGHQALGDGSRVVALKPRGHLDFLVGDALDPPLAGEAFDAVVVQNLYDSVVDPVLLLNQCGALLRPGGLLLLATPYQPGPVALGPEPDLALRQLLGTGACGATFTCVTEGETTWGLPDGKRRLVLYRCDVLVGRKLTTV